MKIHTYRWLKNDQRYVWRDSYKHARG
uniref:Uncharacterized protein n=1 Tax=Arundo donax TaxID=35708 RepID=A0A0A8YQP3_ARUDO